MIDQRFSIIIKDIGNGVLYMLINTVDKWTPYQLFRTIPDKGKFRISFYDEKNEEYELVEDFTVREDFDPYDYIITSSQEKDQITIVCVPRKLILES